MQSCTHNYKILETAKFKAENPISRNFDHAKPLDSQKKFQVKINPLLVHGMSLFSANGVEVKTIQYDFTDPNNYDKIGEQLKGLEIGILGRMILIQVLFIK